MDCAHTPVWNVIPRGVIFQPVLCPESPPNHPRTWQGIGLRLGKKTRLHITLPLTEFQMTWCPQGMSPVITIPSRGLWLSALSLLLHLPIILFSSTPPLHGRSLATHVTCTLFSTSVEDQGELRRSPASSHQQISWVSCQPPWYPFLSPSLLPP